ncbi:MAG: hypothetical protein H0X41_08785, partial [Chitinophagaceae bacterium]|nr:hypothetical protein [Chitinophagaceae bacterium]
MKYGLSDFNRNQRVILAIQLKVVYTRMNDIMAKDIIFFKTHLTGNRRKKTLVMKKIITALMLAAISFTAFSQETLIKYLSGTDKDHTVPWDFYCTGGRNSGKWTKIGVPSNWELQGFGSYNYGHDKVKSNEQGLYKHAFLSEAWQGKKVFIVFEGSMTDTKVMINGKQAGPVHQGSFYRFK